MIAVACESRLVRPGSLGLPRRSGFFFAAPCRVSPKSGSRKFRICAAEVAVQEAAKAKNSQAVQPAVLTGTPQSFPIPPEELIELAKKVHATDTGVTDESVLAEGFRFEFPIVKLSKADYLKSVRSFQLRIAIPDLSSNAYDFRVDPYEPNRVWFTIRTTGTHTGTLKFGRGTYEATGRTIQGGPECCSYTFNEAGLVTSFTGGYVMDNRVGNTGGYGAAFGILAAIGITIPKPNSIQWELAIFVNNLLTGVDKVFKKEN